MRRLARPLGLLAALTVCSVALYEVRHAHALGVPTVTPLVYTGSLMTFGVPDNGTHNMVLSIFLASAGGVGAAACSTVQSVTCANGQFSIPLSASCMTVVQNNSNLQAEVTIDNTPMGLVNVSAVPFAVEAQTAVTASSVAVGGITGILPVTSGGTGASTQNFVDLSSNQTIGGIKTFTNPFFVSDSGAISPTQNSVQPNFEYPYEYTITVPGDPNTFYPVAMGVAANGALPGKIVISRGYYETAPITSSTPDSSHLGGLQAVFTTMNLAWADYCYLTLEHYRWTYVRTIADCNILSDATTGQALWCRLRGGGFVYHLWANYEIAPSQPAAGSVAYNSGGYVFNYPGTLAASALASNAFAPTVADAPVSAY